MEAGVVDFPIDFDVYALISMDLIDEILPMVFPTEVIQPRFLCLKVIEVYFWTYINHKCSSVIILRKPCGFQSSKSPKNHCRFQLVTTEDEKEDAEKVIKVYFWTYTNHKCISVFILRKPCRFQSFKSPQNPCRFQLVTTEDEREDTEKSSKSTSGLTLTTNASRCSSLESLADFKVPNPPKIPADFNLSLQ